MMRVTIVSGKDAGSIREYDDAAAQSLLDTGFAVLAPVEITPPVGPEPVPTKALPPESRKGDKGP